MKISVITPVYNREDCILRCLESVAVFNKNGSRVEHVLTDDGSSDRSADIVEAFATSHPDVKLVRFPKNRGTNAARNAAIAAASGEYCLMLDSDDYLTPDALDNIETVMAANPQFEIYLSACSHTHNQTAAYGPQHIFSFDDFLLSKVSFDFNHVVKRSILLEFPYDENLRIYESVFNLRLYRKAGKILYSDIVTKIIDLGRTDHVTRTLRKTNDKALRDSRRYTNLFIDWYADDLKRTDEGRRRLAEMQTDRYRLAVLSGEYAEADNALANGGSASAVYKLAATTHMGPLLWFFAKKAMKLKWFVLDRMGHTDQI